MVIETVLVGLRSKTSLNTYRRAAPSASWYVTLNGRSRTPQRGAPTDCFHPRNPRHPRLESAASGVASLARSTPKSYCPAFEPGQEITIVRDKMLDEFRLKQHGRVDH